MGSHQAQAARIRPESEQQVQQYQCRLGERTVIGLLWTLPGQQQHKKGGQLTAESRLSWEETTIEAFGNGTCCWMLTSQDGKRRT